MIQELRIITGSIITEQFITGTQAHTTHRNKVGNNNCTETDSPQATLGEKPGNALHVPTFVVVHGVIKFIESLRRPSSRKSIHESPKGTKYRHCAGRL